MCFKNVSEKMQKKNQNKTKNKNKNKKTPQNPMNPG